MLTPWLSELTKKVDSLRPAFIALHMQELGGKNYKTSMQLISPFFKYILSLFVKRGLKMNIEIYL